MDVSITKEWVTLGGAFVAAVAGVWNLAIQMTGKRDRFLVRLGPFSPDPTPEKSMHVVSLSDHKILLSDWGFIDKDLKIRSIRVELAFDDFHEFEVYSRGSSLLEDRSDLYEVGYLRRDEPIGAFALSVAQTRPRVYFASHTPLWQRLVVRTKLLYPRWAYGY